MLIPVKCTPSVILRCPAIPTAPPTIQFLPTTVLPAIPEDPATDRKSTRLNSSHVRISYAVFCLKKKKKKQHTQQERSKQLRSRVKLLCHRPAVLALGRA